VKYPQVVALEYDGWLGKQLRDLARESRWLIHSVRTSSAVKAHLQRGNPTVVLIQTDLSEEQLRLLALIDDIRRLDPDVSVIVVSDIKLPDAERCAWTTAILDLGARYVLFPPLTKPVLEDVVSGLLSASINRIARQAIPNRVLTHKSTQRNAVIDLADQETQA
jgi:DNA-binding NtrC family response regulator